MDYAPTSGVNNMTNVNTGVDQLARRLLEVQLPMANLTRIMRGILPTNAKINDGSKESMQKLGSYYINRITKKAKERCNMERRKTVTAEDILWAMINMGLTIHARLLAQYLNRDFEMAAENDGSPSEASTSIVMPAYPFRQLG
ncbi:nuclear transcription factor Y subunit B-6-like isoform X2 [Solanum lycopersicum]|uniref:nuclear transcription factor Y subunit B-6-like isoform X2 n=1 Tax=Solanum lycopersicum TaxID=4081 RepID=UPI0002BCA9C3